MANFIEILELKGQIEQVEKSFVDEKARRTEMCNLLHHECTKLYPQPESVVPIMVTVIFILLENSLIYLPLAYKSVEPSGLINPEELVNANMDSYPHELGHLVKEMLIPFGFNENLGSVSSEYIIEHINKHYIEKFRDGSIIQKDAIISEANRSIVSSSISDFARNLYIACDGQPEYIEPQAAHKIWDALNELPPGNLQPDQIKEKLAKLF